MRFQNLILTGLVLSASACHHKDAPTGGTTTTAPGDKSDKKLFDRLGGMDAIKAVVDDFAGNVLADPAVNATFKGVDPVHFKQMLVDQICNATGGPCEYKGKDMVTAHKGMAIKDEQFDAVVADLVKSLDKFKVPAKEKGELLGALGGMKSQIVGQ
jgi:hemoglobin